LSFLVISEQCLGAAALEFLGNPGKDIQRVTRTYIREKRAFTIETLFTFTQIGSEESNALVSYFEVASLVQYLISEFGIIKFRQVSVIEEQRRFGNNR
jgi:hypothetical protein